jgi:serine/threonine-protein kinase
MGEVWVARDRVMERSVAVKLLQDHLGTAEGEELFFREARTAGALSHPGIVTVHDLGRDGDGTFYLVMEHVPGRDLAVVLRDGAPPVADTIAWIAQAADALHAAHTARILHRDLKPANLMRRTSGRRRTNTKVSARCQLPCPGEAESLSARHFRRAQFARHHPR